MSHLPRWFQHGHKSSLHDPDRIVLGRVATQIACLLLLSFAVAACASPRVRIVEADGTQRFANDTDFTVDPFREGRSEKDTATTDPSGGNTPPDWNAPSPALRVEPVPDIDGDPEKLIGLSNGSVLSLLGQPVLIRREEQVEIWQYGDEACVMDLFLVRQGSARASGTPASGSPGTSQQQSPNVLVEFFETRDRTGTPTDAERCLSGLLSARGLV